MIEIIATSLSMVGAIINAKGNIIGFYIWSVANVLWIVRGAQLQSYGLCILFTFYLATCVYGVYTWRKNEKL